MNDLCFYPNCDYAISKRERELFSIDLLCPRCGLPRAVLFYSVGSLKHKQRRCDFEAGLISGNPPPYEEPTNEQGQIDL